MAYVLTDIPSTQKAKFLPQQINTYTVWANNLLKMLNAYFPGKSGRINANAQIWTNAIIALSDAFQKQKSIAINAGIDVLTAESTIREAQTNAAFKSYIIPEATILSTGFDFSRELIKEINTDTGGYDARNLNYDRPKEEPKEEPKEQPGEVVTTPTTTYLAIGAAALLALFLLKK